MKYFKQYKKNGRTYYSIRKQYKKKELTIIHTPDKEEALRVYKECDNVDWNKEALQAIKEKYKQRKKIRENQYIYNDDHGGYRIAKWNKGRCKYYGKSSTIEHARKIRDYLIRNGWKRTQYQNKNVSPNKYLSRTNHNHYSINKDGHNYGTFNTYQEAITYRQHLIKNNWDKRESHRIRGKTNPHRYITVQNKGVNPYQIVKQIGGRMEYFGCFPTMEEAMVERDFLESIDWDWDLIDLY